MNEVLKGYEKGGTMRNRIGGALQAKLKAIVVQIAEKNNGRQKIQSAIVSCQEIAKLSLAMKLSSVILKKIEQMKKEIKEEVEKAKNLLDNVAPSETKVIICMPQLYILLI